MDGGSNAGRGSPVSNERVLTGEEIHEQLQRASIAARLIPRTKAGVLTFVPLYAPPRPAGRHKWSPLSIFSVLLIRGERMPC